MPRVSDIFNCVQSSFNSSHTLFHYDSHWLHFQHFQRTSNVQHLAHTWTKIYASFLIVDLLTIIRVHSSIRTPLLANMLCIILFPFSILKGGVRLSLKHIQGIMIILLATQGPIALTNQKCWEQSLEQPRYTYCSLDLCHIYWLLIRLHW